MVRIVSLRRIFTAANAKDFCHTWIAVGRMPTCGWINHHVMSGTVKVPKTKSSDSLADIATLHGPARFATRVYRLNILTEHRQLQMIGRWVTIKIGANDRTVWILGIDKNTATFPVTFVIVERPLIVGIEYFGGD